MAQSFALRSRWARPPRDLPPSRGLFYAESAAEPRRQLPAHLVEQLKNVDSGHRSLGKQAVARRRLNVRFRTVPISRQCNACGYVEI